jgi:hypothetical protein
MLKELNMRNLKKFLGIIALVAVIGLVMISCGKDEDSAPPAAAPEAIFYLSADYGAYQSYPISATVREFKPPEGGARIDIPKTTRYNNTSGITGTGDDILICWFQEDAAEGLYAEFKKASTEGSDANAARIPVVAKPEVEGDAGTAYESYLGTITKEEFAASLIDSSSNSSPKGLLFKPSVAGKYVAGIAVAQKFKEWFEYTPGTSGTDGTDLKPSLPKFLFSNIVTVGGAASLTAHAEYVGKWDMKYDFTPAGQTTFKKGREVLKISEDTFRIFLNYNDEGIQFKISGWTPITEGLTINGIFNPEDGTPLNGKTFSEGYKLVVGEVLLNMGYTNYQNFNIYKNLTDGTGLLTRTNNNGASLIRSYATRTSPENIPLTDDWTVTGDVTEFN